MKNLNKSKNSFLNDFALISDSQKYYSDFDSYSNKSIKVTLVYMVCSYTSYHMKRVHKLQLEDKLI